MQNISPEMNVKINLFKEDKSLITEESLTELRACGKIGKQLALEILELKEGESLSEIHVLEIQKCREDLFYFKENYLLILNKDKLQDKMINAILNNNKIQLTSNKGTKKSYAAIIYALWKFNFGVKQAIGVSADKTVWSKEFVSNTINLYNQLPTWLTVPSRNLKTSMTSANGSKIIIDKADKNIFRGTPLTDLIIEASSHINQDNFKNILNTVIPGMRGDSKIIVIEPHTDVPSDFIEINEFSEEFTEPVKTSKPILRRTFKQIIKDIVESLYNKIKG